MDSNKKIELTDSFRRGLFLNLLGILIQIVMCGLLYVHHRPWGTAVMVIMVLLFLARTALSLLLLAIYIIIENAYEDGMREVGRMAFRHFQRVGDMQMFLDKQLRYALLIALLVVVFEPQFHFPEF